MVGRRHRRRHDLSHPVGPPPSYTRRPPRAVFDTARFGWLTALAPPPAFRCAAPFAAILMCAPSVASAAANGIPLMVGGNIHVFDVRERDHSAVFAFSILCTLSLHKLAFDVPSMFRGIPPSVAFATAFGSPHCSTSIRPSSPACRWSVPQWGGAALDASRVGLLGPASWHRARGCWLAGLRRRRSRSDAVPIALRLLLGRRPSRAGLAEERLLADGGARTAYGERCPLSALPAAPSPSGTTRLRCAPLRSQSAPSWTAAPAGLSALPPIKAAARTYPEHDRRNPSRRRSQRRAYSSPAPSTVRPGPDRDGTAGRRADR